MDAKTMQKVTEHLQGIENLTGWTITLYMDDVDGTKLVGVLAATPEATSIFNGDYLEEGPPEKDPLLN